MDRIDTNDLLWKNISSLPYFRGFLRAVEGTFYQDINFKQPVLDLGIGDGHFNTVTFPFSIDIGVDPSFDSLIASQTTHGSKQAVCAAGDHLPFSGSLFPSAFSNSVLEHIQNVDLVLTELKRLIKPKGLLVISVPNDNFTNNLSLGKFFLDLGLRKWASAYQRFFNRISRHYHPDPVNVWAKRIKDAGFEILDTWNYFNERALSILEWGHLFGIPSWISKKIFGKWVLFPTKWSVGLVYRWLYPYYDSDQRCEEGAYSFFICRKK